MVYAIEKYYIVNIIPILENVQNALVDTHSKKLID